MVRTREPRQRLEPNCRVTKRAESRYEPSGGYWCDLKLGCFAKNWMALDTVVRAPYLCPLPATESA
jgi:hypothetical protein